MSQTRGPIAVIDVKTTGLFPARHDRVVEVAAVVVDPDGHVHREFASLVNPGRDLGPTSIHGLTGEDIAEAPPFAEIAGLLVETLRGCVAIAAHNVRFDRQFLEAEFTRCGTQWPACPCLCTLEMARGKLADCCRAWGVPFDDAAHHALADARAAAALLARCLQNELHWVHDLQDAVPIAWPELPSPSRPPMTRIEAKQRQSAPPSYLQRLLTLTRANPGTFDDGATVAYKALLDRALEDRRVEDSEADSLLETAAAWGLDGQRVALVHESYLLDLVAAALADGVVTGTERRDLKQVARLLGLERMNLENLAQAAAQPSRAPSSTGDVISSQAGLAGKSVCFTGELCCHLAGESLSRSRAEELAAGAGLVIANSVTKSLDILVVADPLTQSGKAKKARQYGVRVIHEPVFWKTIGINVE